MASRLNLQEKLEWILTINGFSRNVYFQPPESKKLKYPCIVYKRSSGRTRFADNRPYTFEESYEVTLIDPDPDSILVREIAMRFPKCRHLRTFISDNLNHDVFTLYWYNDGY